MTEGRITEFLLYAHYFIVCNYNINENRIVISIILIKSSSFISVTVRAETLNITDTIILLI